MAFIHPLIFLHILDVSTGIPYMAGRPRLRHIQCFYNVYCWPEEGRLYLTTLTHTHTPQTVSRRVMNYTCIYYCEQYYNQMSLKKTVKHSTVTKI